MSSNTFDIELDPDYQDGLKLSEKIAIREGLSTAYWVSPISTDTFIKLVKIEGNVRDGANGITQEVQPGVQI